MRRAWVMAAMGFMAFAAPGWAACPAPPRGQPLPREAVADVLPWPPWRGAVDTLSERLTRSDVARARLVFIGDSITAGWQAQIFQQFYGHRAAMNLGISGDATQGLLWRLANGHWPAGLQPRLIVLMIGTNNLGYGSRPENTALGIAAIIAKLQQLSPASRILLLGILPRGATPADPVRPLAERTNQLIASCADGRRVFFADPGPLLLDGAGHLADFVSFDSVHLTMVGYALMAAGIEPSIRQGLQ